MAIQLSILPEEKIFEANAIARANWTTTNVWIQRIAAILISKINPEDKKFKPSEIPLHEIINVNRGGKQYSLVRSVMDEILSQHVVLPVTGSKDLVGYSIFGGSVHFNSKKNTLKVGLNQELAPFYLELKQNFVAYGLVEFLSLPGVYHQALYKFLKSWESLPSKTVDIGELHRILNAAPSLRAHYGRFDQKALCPAHKFINERTTLKFDYEPQKVGRKVVSVVFTFHSKPKFRKAPKTKKGAKNTAPDG